MKKVNLIRTTVDWKTASLGSNLNRLHSDLDRVEFAVELNDLITQCQVLLCGDVKMAVDWYNKPLRKYVFCFWIIAYYASHDFPMLSKINSPQNVIASKSAAISEKMLYIFPEKLIFKECGCAWYFIWH